MFDHLSRMLENKGSWGEHGESEASQCTATTVQAALLLGRCQAARCSTLLHCPVSLFLEIPG